MTQKRPNGDVSFANLVLRNLPLDAIQRLRLRRVLLPVAKEIESPGEPIDSIVFVEGGVASMTTTFEDGSQVEVGLFGFESMLGLSAMMGTKRSLNRIYMQLGGYGYIAPLPLARAEFLRGELFQVLALRCVQAQLYQAAQSAGCNARHEVQQRLARWLLLCSDRAGTNTLAVSQEFIATMLGIRRMSASAALAQFKDWGIIDQHRGTIEILNRGALEAKACECYRALKQHLDDLSEFDPGFKPLQ